MNPNANTMLIYNQPEGIGRASLMARGSGNFSRTAPIPPFCEKLAIRFKDGKPHAYQFKGELRYWAKMPRALKKRITAFRKLNPTSRVAYVCDRAGVDAWLDAHLKSKMHELKKA